MVEVVDIRRVVLKLRTLAAENDNRPVIARDKGCIKALVGFLADATPDDVIVSSLETLKLLASHPSNRDVLLKDAALMERVAKLLPGHDDKAAMARAVHDLLHGAARPALGDLTNTSDAAKPAAPAPKPYGAQPVNAVLKVEGLTGEDDKARLERAAIAVRGVISISIEAVDLGDLWKMRLMAQRILTVRATVRTKTPPDAVIDAINAVGLKASLWRDEDDTPRKSAAREGSALDAAPPSPKYLDSPDASVAKDSVVPAGSAKMFDRRKREAQNVGWLKKVGRALWLA